MKLTIDRIETEYVVCENFETKEILNLDRTIFPSEIKSGLLVEFADGTITILDNNDTEKRIKQKMDDLWE